ncbi:hypothetical protein [Pseudoroseomonas ludipueritiae]|uniref:Uncharacterized protein n=1 Tax=Pseudoroseomonas ludipueritiae TaxID=198093 RepID=A0ABR7R9Y2_9PROT|nr:hypothetical protein [Pseudoroseomonas ludipueritiae]MBC9178600.1 hypothetical protein [Pseudoroseomonas ludipueritiae]MCG7359921.1 hypothetical protein [Roseomonas sp. ACRSG]
MAHAASVNLTSEAPAPRPRSDLSAATGILAALVISVGFWVAVGYAIRAVAG